MFLYVNITKYDAKEKRIVSKSCHCYYLLWYPVAQIIILPLHHTKLIRIETQGQTVASSKVMRDYLCIPTPGSKSSSQSIKTSISTTATAMKNTIGKATAMYGRFNVSWTLQRKNKIEILKLSSEECLWIAKNNQDGRFGVRRELSNFSNLIIVC